MFQFDSRVRAPLQAAKSAIFPVLLLQSFSALHKSFFINPRLCFVRRTMALTPVQPLYYSQTVGENCHLQDCCFEGCSQSECLIFSGIPTLLARYRSRHSCSPSTAALYHIQKLKCFPGMPFNVPSIATVHIQSSVYLPPPVHRTLTYRLLLKNFCPPNS